MLPDVTEASDAGRFRSVQNWIGGVAGYPMGPPTCRLVPGASLYSRRTSVPPCGGTTWIRWSSRPLRMHSSSRSIPFADGSGRIGRVLMNALWRARGVTRSVSVPITAALAAHRSRHFSALDRYREGDIDTVTGLVAECATEASDAGCASAARLRELPGQWTAQVIVRSDFAAVRLIDQLVGGAAGGRRRGCAFADGCEPSGRLPGTRTARGGRCPPAPHRVTAGHPVGRHGCPRRGGRPHRRDRRGRTRPLTTSHRD